MNEADRIIRALQREMHEVDQILGQALGYPQYPDDFPDSKDVCTGEHTVVTLAMEAARYIAELERRLAEARRGDV